MRKENIKTIVIICLVLIILLSIVVLSDVEIQVSEDNLTWINVSYVDDYYGFGFETNLTQYTTYYFRAKNSSTNWTYKILEADYKYGGSVKMVPIVLYIFLGLATLFFFIAISTRTPVFFWVTVGILVLVSMVLLTQGISIQVGEEIDTASVGTVTKEIVDNQYTTVKDKYTNGLAIILIVVSIFLSIAAFRQKEYI